jgi:hypothetical protein
MTQEMAKAAARCPTREMANEGVLTPQMAKASAHRPTPQIVMATAWSDTAARYDFKVARHQRLSRLQRRSTPEMAMGDRYDRHLRSL